jgi:hypothetical protein
VRSATVEHARAGSSGRLGPAHGGFGLPAISVRICSGDGRLVVRISDQGGGIPPPVIEQVGVGGVSGRVGG